MLKLFGFLIKMTLFVGAIVLLAGWLSWDGRSLSSHVSDGLASVERLPWVAEAESWLGMTRGEVRRGARRQHHAMASHLHGNSSTHHATSTVAGGNGMQDSLVTENSAENARPSQERVSQTERQKLRALIQELNSSKSSSKN